MNTTHLSEEQLQYYAMRKPIGKVPKHLCSCADCQFHIDIYRTIHLGLQVSRESKLDFEVNEELFIEIARRGRVKGVAWNYLYLFLTGMLLFLIMILFTLWETIVYIFSGISATWLLFGLVFIAGIVVIQGVEIYQVAKQKIGALNNS